MATLLAHLLAIISIKHFRTSQILLLIASALQTIVCGQVILSDTGWIFNAQNAFLVVSWLSNIIVLLSGFRLFVLRLLIHLIAMSVLVWIYYLPHASVPQSYQWTLDIHILFSVLAYSLLFVSSIVSVSLGYQIHKMKKNVFISQSMTINSLLKNEEKLFKLILFGWLFLTCGLLTGIMFVNGFLAQGIGHKVVFSFLAWVLFAILIFGRITKGWRGKTAIRLNLIAMSLLMLGFIGSYVVLDYVI